MKKMLLIGMLIVSGLSYGRDFEYRERSEFRVVEDRGSEDKRMVSRNREGVEVNMEKYSEFHRDLNNQSRGREKR